MAVLSERKVAIVRILVESAPDKIVGGLRKALAAGSGDSVLAPVLELVEQEAQDRWFRNTVMKPVLPMFADQVAGGRDLVFPPVALAQLWHGLKVIAPEEFAAAEVYVTEEDAVAEAMSVTGPATFDVLTAMAAHGLRAAGSHDFRLAAAACNAARPGGAEQLAACLDLAPIVRRAIPRLPQWLAHPDEDVTTALRLAYKDVVEIAADGGPRFFEMLAAQLDQPWKVMRIISAVMYRPTERYLSECELKGFPERIMAEIDASVVAISRLDRDAGPDVGRATGKRVELITRQINELEAAIALTRERGWGRRIADHKRALAAGVEARLHDAEVFARAALPMRSIGFARKRRSIPQLSDLPDDVAVARATTLLAFADEVRASANYAGFSAAHTRLEEKLGHLIDGYVEEVLDDVRLGDVEDVSIAHAFLRVAADFSARVQGDTAADLIRRRALAACHGEPPVKGDVAAG